MRQLVLLGTTLVLSAAPAAWDGFVNFETAPVHPVALGPDGRTLAVCNLPDGRVELFEVSSGVPQPTGNVPVGVDPVSVRWRTSNELWVVNHISRSISVVDVERRLVVETLATRDGPADVVFAGATPRAFVSCSKENTVQVFDAPTRQWITNLVLDGERPKAMALSPDGSRLYVAIFESGNRSTILVGSGTDTQRVLRHPDGPYGGQFPVPNDGDTLRPPLNSGAVGFEGFLPDSLVLKKNASGRWRDDNGGDWTEFVSGAHAPLSGRIPGWDLPDHDLAVIDTATLDVGYATGLMNLCMEVAVNPASGRIAVVGTDGVNERRFEPNLQGTFLRVNLALVDPATLQATLVDLNPHLDYAAPRVDSSLRELSLGDPRGLVWNSAGTRGYLTGMGSRNLVVIDADGRRVGSAPVDLDEGPSGLALDEPRERLYVLNRFASTLSVVDTAMMSVLANLPLFDPTPPAIKVGRKHLYDTRRNSGLGHAACASCHPDARLDRLAWDLGDPRAEVRFDPRGGGEAFHPMKGPLVTQTLQDIIQDTENEPFMRLHWRGDRADLESFNVTFTDLLGRDALLTDTEMGEFKAFLSTIHFPPSRFREADNSMPTQLPLPGFFGVDANGVPDATPLPNGNAVAGGDRFFFGTFDGRFPLTMGEECLVCHNRQSGGGVEGDFELFKRDGDRPFKGAQLRGIADKLGFNLRGTNSRAGFGFRFDGRADTLTTLFADVFAMTNNQVIADLTAFLLAFPGSDIVREIPPGGMGSILPKQDSQDAHAAVGRQQTLHAPQELPWLTPILAPELLFRPPPDLVIRGVKDGLGRGWYYVFGVDYSMGGFQSDRNHEKAALPALLALAGPDTPLTFTVVPPGTGRRLGADRDGDGVFDRTELDTGFDPSDPLSHPSLPPPLAIVHEAVSGRITLSWSDTGVFAMDSTTNLTPPVEWSVVPGEPELEGGQWSLGIPAPAHTRYFRLRTP